MSETIGELELRISDYKKEIKDRERDIKRLTDMVAVLENRLERMKCRKENLKTLGQK